MYAAGVLGPAASDEPYAAPVGAVDGRHQRKTKFLTTPADVLANEAGRLLHDNPDLALERFMAAHVIFVRNGETAKSAMLCCLIARTWERKRMRGRALKWARRAVAENAESSSGWAALAHFYEGAGKLAASDTSKRRRALASFSLSYICLVRAAALSNSDEQKIAMHRGAERIIGYASRLV